MASQSKWSKTVPRILYEAYPDQDLLPIEPPQPGETIGKFKLRAEDAGDTLFLFLCREADDEIDADEYVARLDRAMRDIACVRHAFRREPCPRDIVTCPWWHSHSASSGTAILWPYANSMITGRRFVLVAETRCASRNSSGSWLKQGWHGIGSAVNS